MRLRILLIVCRAEAGCCCGLLLARVLLLLPPLLLVVVDDDVWPDSVLDDDNNATLFELPLIGGDIHWVSREEAPAAGEPDAVVGEAAAVKAESVEPA